MMRQLNFITAYLALCSCTQLASFMARSTTYESVGVSVATFLCDVDDCTFEGNCSKSLKKHKLTHSAALLHCDFMGCSYETKNSSNLKRHKLSHTTKESAAALLHCDFMGCSFETKYASSLKRHKLSHTTKVAAEKAMAKDTEAEKEDGNTTFTVEQINTPSPPKKQRLSNQIPIHGLFGGSRNASIDAGLQKASEFFSSPNVTRTTCACCNELQKAKNISAALLHCDFMGCS